VRTAMQDVDAVMGIIEVGIGEMRMQAVMMEPAAPLRLANALPLGYGGARRPVSGTTSGTGIDYRPQPISCS
jgi:hypothetical protein